MSEISVRQSRAIPHLLIRATDIVVASTMLVLLSPVMLLVCCILGLNSPDSILFHQIRVRPGGRTFQMLKFRTLQATESNIPWGELAARGEIRYIQIGRWPIGLWLRRMRIDELPQIINVLRGEMSMVGLRPALPTEAAVLSWREENSFTNFPIGITGSYQTGGSKDLGLTERFALEREQCLNWSYWQYWRILLKTILVVIMRKGAGG